MLLRRLVARRPPPGAPNGRALHERQRSLGAEPLRRARCAPRPCAILNPLLMVLLRRIPPIPPQPRGSLVPGHETTFHSTTGCPCRRTCDGRPEKPNTMANEGNQMEYVGGGMSGGGGGGQATPNSGASCPVAGPWDTQRIHKTIFWDMPRAHKIILWETPDTRGKQGLGHAPASTLILQGGHRLKVGRGGGGCTPAPRTPTRCCFATQVE